MNSAFSDGEALSSLLGLQGLLLAAAGLLMVVLQPDQDRRVEFRVFTPMAALRLVAFGGICTGIGSIAAWIAVFTGGSFVGGTRVFIAAGALVAILIMMVVTLLLLFARRT